MATILSLSYDLPLLSTREKILRNRGHVVTSVRNMAEAVKLCQSSTQFDLLIVGHSIPHAEKEAVIEAFGANRPATPVIALKRQGEELVQGADLLIEPNPDLLLNSVAKLVSAHGASA